MTAIAPIPDAVPSTANAAGDGNFGGGAGVAASSSRFSDVLTSVSPAASGAVARAAGGKSNSPQAVASAAPKPSAPQLNRSSQSPQSVAAAVAPANLVIVNPHAASAPIAPPPSASQVAADDAASVLNAATDLTAKLADQLFQPEISAGGGSGSASSAQVGTTAAGSEAGVQPAAGSAVPDSDGDNNGGIGADGETPEGIASAANGAEDAAAGAGEPEALLAAAAAPEAGAEVRGATTPAPDQGRGQSYSHSSNAALPVSATARPDTSAAADAARTLGAPPSAATSAAADNPLRGEAHNSGFTPGGSASVPAALRTDGGAAAPRAGYGEIARGVGAPSSADLQKAISDTREKLVQQIGAHLQAELSAAPAKAIGSVATTAGTGAGIGTGTSTSTSLATGSGGNGNLTGQNSGNSSSNSATQDAVNPSETAPPNAAGNHTGTASAVDTLNASIDPTAGAKPVLQAAPAADTSAHVALDVSTPAAPVAATTNATATASAASASTANVARPVPLPEALPQSLNDVVKASELYQRVGGSEMHIAMQTELLGAVDLRAAMHQSTLTATISVQRSDVQSLLANELPALQHALADKNFHVEQIAVLNNSVGGRSGSGSQQPAQQQYAPASRGVPIARAAGYGLEDSMATVAGAGAYGGSSDGSGRISVHV